MIQTYSWRGPLSYHSMTAQIMLRYGIRMVPIEGDVQIDYEVTDTFISLQVRWKSSVRRFAQISSRMEAGRRLQDVLTEWTGSALGEWGYLIGMRPGKLLHRFLGQDDYEAKAGQFLMDARVAPQWIDCLIKIGTIQARYLLMAEMRKRVAVYIGIPYCPSHCTYCSFPAKIVTGNEEWEDFVTALCKDVYAAGDLINKQGWKVDSIYYGGGTPTVLPEYYLEILLQAIWRTFFSSQVEYTVEAGRPDTMSEEKLDLMVSMGVNRISVNPQTLQDQLLRKVHRTHGTKAITQVYKEVRKRPFKVINMDFIAGLPGQSLANMQENIQTVLKWRPENVTVHSLAMKRNSPLAKGNTELPSADETKQMIEMARRLLEADGYQPYYLYRQKYMAADVANIGYALPCHESRYNIHMMEECMHVVGIGPGASSRAMQTDGIHLKRLVFPWDPTWYQSHLTEYIAKRERLFTL